MKLTATVAGVTHDIPESGLADLVAFERHFGLSATVLDASNGGEIKVEWIAFVIYRGLLRAGVFAAGTSFDDGVEQIEDFDIVSEEDAQSVDPPVSEPVAS